jgi:pimeloyl-ACP methyl ester carboxylesterase
MRHNKASSKAHAKSGAFSVRYTLPCLMTDAAALRQLSVTSEDGTSIACYAGGAGPPLVLVHGALTDHTSWEPLSPFRWPHFTVHAYDRRGRGASSDTLPHSTQREIEDLEAVLEAAGPSRSVFGHSSGAVLALEVAQRGFALNRLALYEPPIQPPATTPPAVDDDMAGVVALLKAERRDDAVKAFLRAANNASDADMLRLQSQPRWAAQVAMASTLLYDLDVTGGFALDARALAKVNVPALLLAGAVSPPRMRLATESLHALLPDSRLQVLEGQSHFAIFSAPAAVADALVPFLTNVEPKSHA